MDKALIINQHIQNGVKYYIRKQLVLHYKKRSNTSSFPFTQLLLFAFIYSLFIQFNSNSLALLDRVTNIEQNCKTIIENQVAILQRNYIAFHTLMQNYTENIDIELNNLASSLKCLSNEIRQVNATIPAPPITIKIEDDQVNLILKKIIIKLVNAKNNNLNYLTKHSLRLYSIQDYAHYLYTPPCELVPEISTIFSLEAFSLINNWIGYVGKYKLVFRASRDGYTGDNFYQKCSSYYPTVVIIKNNYGKIFGGYNPQAWSKPDLASSWSIKSDLSKETFIFSISMKKKFALIDQMTAIMANKDYGLSFGGWERLSLGNKCNITDSCTGNSAVSTFETAPVKDFIGRNDGIRFSVIDYEVFVIEN